MWADNTMYRRPETASEWLAYYGWAPYRLSWRAWGATEHYGAGSLRGTLGAAFRFACYCVLLLAINAALLAAVATIALAIGWLSQPSGERPGCVSDAVPQNC